jgi:DHA1 family inner membrane transport protein
LAGAIGGALGWRAAFALMGTASVFLALLIWVRLPESSLERSRPGALIGAYRVVLRSRGLPQILLANIFERSVFSIVGGFTAAFLMQTYGLDLLHVAPLLALAAVGTIVGNVVGGRLADRQAQARVYAQGQILSAGFGLLLYVTGLGPLASVLLCIGFGLTNAASRPAILAMTSALAPQHRGTAIGVFSLTNQLGWALGPAAAGLAYALAGYSAIGLLCGAAAAGAGLMMLPLLRR